MSTQSTHKLAVPHYKTNSVIQVTGRKTLAAAAACLLLVLHAGSTYADNTASFEVGTGNRTQMERIGLQSKWEQQWWRSNGSHIGGYWDMTLARWHGNRFDNVPGQTQNLYDIGITPVFRLQRDSLTGPYYEMGVGAHYQSDLYNNNGRKLSTRLEFGSQIGIGYVFDNKLDIGLKVQHFSNGGIKHPNNGVNFAVASVGYRF